MPDNRFPKQLALRAIERGVFWFKDLDTLVNKYDIGLNLREEKENMRDPEGIRGILNNIYKSVLRILNCELVKSLENSSFSPVYNILKFDPLHSYLKLPTLSFKRCIWIMKCRGDVLNVRANTFGSGSVNCQLCGDNDIDDLFHFVATCPALASIRGLHLGKPTLSGEEAERWINGQNWHMLSSFIESAYSLRRGLH